MERLSKINLELNNDLSAEDFQEKLYQWLEEQGILPGLRTYLRHQLISALKRTHLSSEYLNKKRNNLSLKDTSLNLLIAEYLVQQNYQYTASIFYSEEPRLGKLPIQLKLPSEGEEPLKIFTENEVEEILESLSLAHSSKFVREVIDSYSKHSTSLLKAIVKTVAARSKNFQLKKTESSGEENAGGGDSTINWSDERDYKASAEKVNKSKTNKHQQGKSTARDKEKSSSSDNKEIEIERRVEEAVIKMRGEMDKEMAEQRKTLEDGLMAKQQRIVEMVNHLQEQQAKLQDHFKKIQEKEEMLDVKEKRLEGMQHQESIHIAEKHNEIKSSQRKLEEEFQRLRQEKNTIILLQKEMEATHKQIIEVANYLGNSQMELDVLQSLNLENNQKSERKDTQPDMINSYSSHSTMNLAESLRLMKENAGQAYQKAIHKLREKNSKLQSLANEQQSKINKLSTTVSALSVQLEDATAAVRLLSTQDVNKSKMQPMEGHLTYPVQEKLEHEEYKTMYREKRPERNIQRSHDKRFSRRQKSEEESASSTASSPTEDILREARHRLRRLEIESDEVDRRYYNFKQKHLSEGFRFSSLSPNRDMECLLLDKSTSWMRNSHERDIHSTGKGHRSSAEVYDVDPLENNPKNGKQVSSNFNANHIEYNRKSKSLKEKRDRNLFNMNGSTQVKSLADNTPRIASTNEDALENNRQLSSPIHLVPKEITSPVKEQLPAGREGGEIQKEDPSQMRDENHLTEKNHLNTSKLSDSPTHEDHHQIELKTAERNPEMESKSQINSFTRNHHNNVAGIGMSVLAGEEKINEQMQESNDSLTSSSVKLSVGANVSKAEDSFW